MQPIIMDRQGPRTRRDDSATNRRGRRTGGVHTREDRQDRHQRTYNRARNDRRDYRYDRDRHRRYGYYDHYHRYRRYRGFRYCYTPYWGYYYDTPYYSSSPFRWYYNPYYGFYGAFSFWTPYWFVPSVSVYYSGGGYGSGVYGSSGSAGYESSYGTGVGVGSLDLDVSPEKALIFVDGNLVGTADDYDGFPDYLWLEEGTYDVAIYHPGYETIFRQYTIYPGLTIDVEDRMRPGEAIHPDDYGPKSTERRDARIEQDRQRREAVERARLASPTAPSEPAARSESTPGEGALIGRLLLDIWPPDAVVYLDGNFLGQASEVSQLSAGLLVEPGEHALQVVHPDYPKRDIDLDIGPGERQELAIVLEK